MHDLHDAVMFNEGCLLGFESQVKEALGEHGEKNKGGATIERGIKQVDEQINHLKEIFDNPVYYAQCINILKEIDPPVINGNNKYIGRNKSMLCIWIDELKRRSFIKPCPDDIYAKLLNEALPGLNMTKDGSLFRKRSIRAEDFRKNIQVLLSQISQRGR